MAEVRKLSLSSSQDFATRKRVGLGARLRLHFQWSNWLGWQQWLVLFGMGVMVIGFEIRNHNIMWREHNSGQTFWTDQMLVWEVFIFGLVLPILGGIVMGYVGRTAIERDRMAREMELRRGLSGQMQEAKSWQELAELVVTTPGSVASADRAWLLAQRNGEETFNQIARWERLGQGLLPSALPVVPTVCERCQLVTNPSGSRILACPHKELGNEAYHSTRYCLWLSAERQGITALLFDVPLSHPLDPGQIKMLDELGGDMSLAIDNANLHDAEQRQGEVVKKERLRIARDINDTLGQNVSFLRLKLEQINSATQLSGRGDFQGDFAKMLGVAEEAYEQVRDTLEELRTTEHRDLEQDVRLYGAQVSERSGFSVDFQSSGQVRELSHRQNRELMYIVREALNNVEKHARAQIVFIVFRWQDGELNLTVADDGKGFRPDEMELEDHYGLAIMRERAQSISAELVITSTPGKGTELTVSLPWSERTLPAAISP